MVVAAYAVSWRGLWEVCEWILITHRYAPQAVLAICLRLTVPHERSF